MSETVQHTFRYRLDQTIEAMRMTQPHCSKDDVTPIITGMLVTLNAFMATDRYTLAKHTVETVSHDTPSEETTITIPAAAIDWIIKTSTKTLRNSFSGDNLLKYHVDITETVVEEKPTDLTVSILYNGAVERSQTFNPLEGNYPPIERLIDAWKPAQDAYDVRVGPQHLEKVTSIVKRLHKEEPITIELGEQTEHKPSPVRITHGETFTALIQPNLKL